MFGPAGELGNAHSHARLDRRVAARAGGADTPARDFGAYSATFDGRALGVGESADAGPGVTLMRRG